MSRQIAVVDRETYHLRVTDKNVANDPVSPSPVEVADIPGYGDGAGGVAYLPPNGPLVNRGTAAAGRESVRVSAHILQRRPNNTVIHVPIT